MKLSDELMRKCLELAGQSPQPLQPEPEKVSEKEFLWKVINYAEAHGWKWYHVFYSQKSPEGFPDLLLLRERQVVAELKKENEKPTKDQEAWLEAFRRAKSETYVWRPSDWPQIEKVLA